MSRRLTPQRFVIGLVCLIAFEGALSTASLHYARRAKADLEKTFPGQQVHLTSAVWVDVRCGTFRLDGEPPGQIHRFLDDGVPVTTDLDAPDPDAFDARWRSCTAERHGRGDWQNPIFDSLVLPRV